MDERERNDAVRKLLTSVDQHSPGEADHAQRTSVFAVATGERLGIPFDELVVLRRAAALHDVGKLAVDRDLLLKTDPLSEGEMAEVRSHVILAAPLLESHDWLVAELPLILHHHERWDGNGYPDGLTGESIPLGSRIIAAAEAFDWMVYMRGTRCEPEAIEEMRRCSGTQFHPEIVEAFIEAQPLIQPLH